MRRIGMKAAKVLLAASLGMMTACAPKVEGKQQTLHVVWKSPSLRYADMAFIRRGETATELKLFALAHPLATLYVTPRRICRKSLCEDAASFNAAYLSSFYPPDTLYRILRKAPIFDGSHMQKKRHGFTQHLKKKSKYDIVYTVLKNRVEFHDRINHIDLIFTEGSDE